MQAIGVASLFLCVACLFVLFAGKTILKKIIFSLRLMMISLGLPFREILLSVNALNLELSDMQKD